jgi:hypothetical protein
VNSDTFKTVTTLGHGTRLLGAARVNLPHDSISVRLIDNLVL